MDTSRYFWNTPGAVEAEGDDRSSSRSADRSIEPGRWDSSWPPVKLGFVGIGLMGGASLKRMLHLETEVAALCDVDGERLDAARERVAAAIRDASAASGRDSRTVRPCRTYGDFRDLCGDPDVEAVVVSTPDHWHVDVAIEAMEAGKDVYVEKPLSLTIAGGRRLADTARRTGRVVQTGSQQRSSAEFLRACGLVRNGALGRLESILVSLPPNNVESPTDITPVPVPNRFDHSMWLGPAPYRHYHPDLCHYNFRFISDYSGGQMTNWGAHHLDIVQWALGMDEWGPIEVSGTGQFHGTGPFDTAIAVDLTYRYAGGLPVYCRTEAGASGVEFRGDRGVLRVGRGRLEAEPAGILDRPSQPDDILLYRSDNHYIDFLQSVRRRTQPVAPAETGHRSATVCHLGNIAIKLGRPLRWDPGAELVEDDVEANSLLDRPSRDDWKRA